MEIKIKRIGNGSLPEYKTDRSAGADCYARLENEITIKADRSETIPLGFAVEIPAGYEMQIRGRSGLARKNSIDCFPGTIDSDYRGEVCAIILNKGQEDFTVKPSDRIAQAVIAPVIKARWSLTENLSETERGEGGFGHTGISENKDVEKFYEPFTKIEEVEKYFNRKVKIDSYLDGVVVGCKKDPAFSWFYVLIELNENQKMNDSSSVEMSLSKAFERVTIDGHRFGKEIEFEND
jgi:dUTP pyrophosphatase